jgi:hypothetical protein
MIGRFGGDGDRGPLLASALSADRAEVGVLDGPPVGLDRGDRHAEGDLVALPGTTIAETLPCVRAYSSIARETDAAGMPV